jgi:hypothetical protein
MYGMGKCRVVFLERLANPLYSLNLLFFFFLIWNPTFIKFVISFDLICNFFLLFYIIVLIRCYIIWMVWGDGGLVNPLYSLNLLFFFFLIWNLHLSNL